MANQYQEPPHITQIILQLYAVEAPRRQPLSNLVTNLRERKDQLDNTITNIQMNQVHNHAVNAAAPYIEEQFRVSHELECAEARRKKLHANLRYMLGSLSMHPVIYVVNPAQVEVVNELMLFYYWIGSIKVIPGPYSAECNTRATLLHIPIV